MSIKSSFCPGSILSFAIAIVSFAASFLNATAAEWIVRDGAPQAVIVTSDSPERMVQLAASELQTYIEKMTGARLPIVTAGQTEASRGPRLFVGRSPFTDQLGIETADLADGAYRIISGDDWLVLIGRDIDFVPREPWARNHADMARMFKEQDEMTGAQWGNGVGTQMQRRYSRRHGWWEFDERGSLNAVYAWLRSLGVEWYMQGDLGEIVPEYASLQFPEENIDLLVVPEFGLRYHHGTAFIQENDEDILWYLRLGLNSHSDTLGHALEAFSHGMSYVHNRSETKENHPEYFALRGGQRATKLNQPCLSNEELFEQHVAYVRFLFDQYDMPMVSIFPEDGGVYCDCDSCKPQATPERGWLGSHSDYVWNYVNRVAREVYKSHPDRLVSCFAYANYALPPLTIDKLSPNLVVGLLPLRRSHGDPAIRQRDLALREAWREKLGADQPFILWGHYPFTSPGKFSHGIPAYFPRVIAEDLQSLSGEADGELIEISLNRHPDGKLSGLHGCGFAHLNSYVTSRYYWDTSIDIEELLTTYTERFYGPAAKQMMTFIDFCEKNWSQMSKMAEPIDTAFALLAEAKAAAPEGSVYAARIALIDEYMQPLIGRAEQLRRGRENVPEVRIDARNNVEVKIDGKLDEAAWQNLPGASALRDVVTGEWPKNRTSFRMFWADGNLYIGIVCFENDIKSMPIATTTDNDRSIWDGDNIEIMIETTEHSFYQITINPAGARVELDRSTGINADWSSDAEIATQIDEDRWTIEMRIPVAEPGHTDPLHYIVGSQPTVTYPWFFNICRFRIRGDETELSAFSPTGERHFQNIRVFAELYTGIKPEALEAARNRPAN